MHIREDYFTKGREELLGELEVSEDKGLSQEMVRARLQEYGSNTLKKNDRAFGLHIFFKQFFNPLVVILIAAFAATVYLAEYINAAVILAALLINVIIGFVQEFRASRAFAALLASQEHTVLALRDGAKQLIKTSALVPGDIIFIEAGGVVPADAYVLTASDISVSEAHLTGESSPVEKHTGVLPAETPIYERKNTLFMGSTVLSGTGTAVVLKTGNAAEVGAIAESLADYRSGGTPVQKSIERLARFIALAVTVVIVLLLLFGALRGMPFGETLLLSIALAVSAVPEGLPAAVTVILAIGMEKILRERGLVRNLLAAETLGSTTIILTDKTGTLTEAKMRIVGIVSDSIEAVEPTALTPTQRTILLHALSASDAVVLGGEKEQIHGRPVEKAIASFALDAGVFETAATDVKRRVDFMKFSSERRFAAAVYERDAAYELYATGAPETLLSYARSFLKDGSVHPLTDAARRGFEERFALFSRGGKRLIGVLRVPDFPKQIERTHSESALSGGVFEGFLVLDDPVRADVPQAIRQVREAGVRVVMVTGDTPETASAIAADAGITAGYEPAIAGFRIENMEDDALAELLMTHNVFARVLPHQKKRLVSVLAARGEVVAMTGDGVNDAPALKAAALGIAVGSGTEVAREVSDIVLLDDSFSILVATIREGRRIMDNLKKTITHLVATNFHEVFLIMFAVIAGLPLPLLPLQILWVNILEGGLLTFAFAFEPAEPDVMKRNPRGRALRAVLTQEVKRLIVIAGTITGVFSVALFGWLLSQHVPIEEIRTIMFVVLSLDALFFALSLKRLQSPVWTAPLLNNRFLILSLALSVLGTVLTLTIPFLRNLLDLLPLTAFDFLVLFGVALVNIATIEFAKKVAFPGNAKMTA